LELIDRGENALVEFKSSFQKEVIETLTAFANTQGGAVLNISGQSESQPESRPESQPESGQALEAKVLRLLSTTPMSKRGISAALGQKSVSGQLNKVIRKLVAGGSIEVTLPDKINSRLQQYRLTAQR
jgi:predicted HTH transcriptional regulator